ncbi:MAG: tRNA uridine-5-carboxymethylaminomethyl(34) synthesis GTPase MnmE [Ruminococcus sp.]|nr:tRNA uridine-5-carboxymethylaminomethyl(34) synthesis GTPase MnmE [Ruminococcus sp.]
MNENTIAAISTAQGQGGIGIIRISGNEAISTADKIFVSVSGKRLCDLEGYRAAYGKISENSEMIDEVVAIVYRAPYSYTGEDVVEICCHGGLFVTREVLRAAINAGAILAEPGEFTKRAFLNGKMDLSEAQAVMDIISAQSKQAARTALSQRTGALGKKVSDIKNRLVSTVGHLAAWADYPEEDIPEVSSTALLENILDVKASISKLVDEYSAGQAILHGIDTVIAGRPNVGKSTLMNLLSGFDKSIVTNIPGTTRDIVEETVIIGDVTLKLSDTAGIRDTENIVEKIGVDKTRERISSCSLILAVFDSSEELCEEDINLLESIEDTPSIAIINKTDLENKIDLKYIESKIKNIVKISAKTGEGKKELEDAIAEISGTKDFDPCAGIISTERQRSAAIKAISALEDAEQTLSFGFSFDAVTVCIEEAIDALLQLTGENVADAVVDDVFHSFCVGK